jgi:hypothetical protein
MLDPADLATRQETCIVRDGLTCEFRDSVKYQAWRADILQKIPGASDFFIDTAIWWYISKPDMFESEDGKRWIAEMEARKRKPHSIKEEDDDGSHLSNPGHGDICDDAGLRGSASTSGATDHATAATTDRDPHSSSCGSGVEDAVSIDETSVVGQSQ